MKTNNIIFTIAMTIMVIIIIVLLTACGTPAEEYAMSVHVVECDTRADVIVLEDCNGNLWEWEGVEDWQEGDCAACVMSDNGTPSIYDDEIISLRYERWE